MLDSDLESSIVVLYIHVRLNNQSELLKALFRVLHIIEFLFSKCSLVSSLRIQTVGRSRA